MYEQKYISGLKCLTEWRTKEETNKFNENLFFKCLCKSANAFVQISSM